MHGLLADANIVGHVEYLARLMQTGSWAGFWQDLGLVLRDFADVGLSLSKMYVEPGECFYRESGRTACGDQDAPQVGPFAVRGVFMGEKFTEHQEPGHSLLQPAIAVH